LKPIFPRIAFAALLIVILLTAFFGMSCEASPDGELIRIAISKNAAEVVVDGESLTAVTPAGAHISAALPARVRSSGSLLIVDGNAYTKLTFSSPQAVLVNGKPYRGSVELIPQYKGVLVVNQLPLESYLIGLINAEISSAWPIEAVKAQAVIARTFALQRREMRKGALFHMESTVLDQVYHGLQAEDSRAQRAVMDTAGEVLMYHGEVIQAFYHSNCGGRTEASENVWGKALPYLKSVRCDYCLHNPATAWEQRLSLRVIEERLRQGGHRVIGLNGLRTGPLTSGGRLKYILAMSSSGQARITGDQFRKALGYGVIKSTNFKMRAVNGDIVFSGMGNGHGVGLCQWGAKQRALEGFTYTEILSYYYPGTELHKMYNPSER